MHIKGRGGVKGAVRCLHAQIDKFSYTARFDVDSYYGSMNHKVLFDVANKLGVDQSLMNIIMEYVRIPDLDSKGRGIVAGGALSTLLGAIYLSPLDEVMHRLHKKGDIFFIRYQDDFVILAKTRWKLKKAIKLMYQILETLQVKVHTREKRTIGKTEKGFSFLGYSFQPRRKLRLSNQSLKKFIRRVERLIEQGCTQNRILLYIERIYSYSRSGLSGISVP